MIIIEGEDNEMMTIVHQLLFHSFYHVLQHSLFLWLIGMFAGLPFVMPIALVSIGLCISDILCILDLSTSVHYKLPPANKHIVFGISTEYPQTTLSCLY